MDCKLDKTQDGVRITVGGRIDESGAEELKQRLQEAAAADVSDAILDFSQVTYFGSAGVGKLLLFYKALASRDGRISIVNLPDDIYRHFKRVELDQIFTLSRAS